jgi:hypothetical protein
MKTTIQLKLAILFTLGIFAIQTLNASTIPVKNKNTENEKSIREYFKFPQVLLKHTFQSKSESIKVEVLFTTNVNGKVNFVLAKTDNIELKKEIENQFLKLNFKDMKSEVVNSVTLSFKTV